MYIKSYLKAIVMCVCVCVSFFCCSVAKGSEADGRRSGAGAGHAPFS